MPNLAELLADDEPSVLKVGRGELHLRTITPDLLTGEIIDLLAELDRVDPKVGVTLQDAADFLTKQATIVSLIVTWWDATDREGNPVSLVVEEIKKQPKSVLARIIQHVASGEAHRQATEGEAQPGGETKSDSDDTSSRQARLAIVPTGIDTSGPAIASTARPGNSFRKGATNSGTGIAGRKPLSSLKTPKSKPGKALLSPSKALSQRTASGG